MIIDTHCHLDDKQFDADLDDVIKRARCSGVGNIIIPGADINDVKKARNIAYAYDDVFFAVGVHPYNLSDWDEDRLLEFADDPKCVAVGECGLDYFRLKEDFQSDEERIAEKEMQKKVFISQIRLATKLKKPLIVHARDANQDVYDILKEHGKDLVGGVFHCFNASELLLDFEKFYYGIGGVLTFKNAKNLVEILPKIPISKLLVETDAPYLAPTPNRGKRNEPSYTTLVVDKMSEILGFSVSEIESITTKNAKELFKIKE
ncbi:TatD family hydrolase [Campylobacter corcagiensis]|uniref:TatD family hydrolase n=1 Tax=Campylobacter corcagiensis TaxID=1448857 RepID=A0A7M1LGA8_9BACT|nr:TatD family hydrolase [Campylobacter corcagiensis]QKF64451.1 ssDNA/RNA exonuclease, 3' - 5' specific [Campylobacter corcagiensis]QOQ87363.1 TatD family hydrolase [Campylobacter corcagiensis]